MPATFTDKGVAYAWALGEDNWKTENDESQQRISQMLLSAWAQNRATTSGLNYGYHGGVAVVAGAFLFVAGGTTTLADATTNYVERTAAGVVTDNTSGFSADRIPMAIVVTAAGAITSVTDRRPPTAQRPQEFEIVDDIENLAAGADITARAFYRARVALTVVDVRAIYRAASAGIAANPNDAVITLRNITKAEDVASVTLVADVAANAASVVTIVGANADIDAGNILGVVVTQNGTADLGAFRLQATVRP